MSMVEFESPETIDDGGGGNWLKEPGTYHLICDTFDPAPETKDGKSLDAWAVKFEVLAGTSPDCEGKKLELKFWNPKLGGKDGGKFARQKQTKLLIALGVLDPGSLGQKIAFDAEHAEGRQCVATIELNESDTTPGKTFVDLHYTDIWHIDDPRAAKFPRSTEAIGLIPADLRRAPESFAAVAASAKSNGTAAASNGNGSTLKPATAATTAAAATVDLGDL